VSLLAPLFEGPIDVVGDIHGEILALDALLTALGYDQSGEHRNGRRLVFVGDLVDRGPDSPAVVDRVMSLVDRGLAQCVLGNHELNVLRWESKAGNAWLIDTDRAEQQPGGEFAHSRVAPKDFEEPFLNFLSSLPLALKRSDLRVAHAAWVDGEISALAETSRSALDVYKEYDQATTEQLAMEGVTDRAQEEVRRCKHALHDRHAKVELLVAVGERDERIQMGNPVRVVTSGVERLASKPFWASGQWRMCDRVKWWDEYRDDTAVVVGHYWRRLRPIPGSDHAASKPELFDDVQPLAWLGPRENVFCVDYSVGARYEERKKGVTHFETRLAALRWPEREVWGEEGPLKEP
jgi:hypothetical protein